MPYLSIVMPVYGVEKYISTAIESVLSQTFQNWELIIVNDGTKDRSRKIAQEYETKDSRIHIVDKENGGLSDARNVGLLHACGEYIHFFDSDDYISKYYYADCIKNISANTYDVLISGYVVVFHDNQDKEQFRDVRNINNNNIRSLTQKELIDFLEYHFNYAWNKLFRTEFLRNNYLLYKKGLYSIEDAEFMSRVIKYSPRIGLCSSTGYYYVNRERTSLGRCYHREIVDFNASKLEIERTIFIYFIKDYCIVDNLINKKCISIYKFLFKSLLSYSEMTSMPEKFTELNYILNNSTLQITIRKTKDIPLFDKILKTFIIYKIAFAIYIIYKIKGLIIK